MCGLVAVYSKSNKPAGNKVFSVYEKQKARGTEGFGYVSFKNGKLLNVERELTEAKIKPKLAKEQGDLILFHHRKPTSTPNTIGTTHPILVSNNELEYDYYLEHNGVLLKYHELKKKHNDLGYEYTTEYVEEVYARHLDGEAEFLREGIEKFNDSEVLAIELARYIEGLQDSITVEGSVAFVGAQVNKSTGELVNVFFGNNYGRTLAVQDNKKYITISSETGKQINNMTITYCNPYKNTGSTDELPIDEAKPVVTPSSAYANSHRASAVATSTHRVGFDTTRNTATPYTGNLSNRYYTLNEVWELGFQTAQFGTEYVDLAGTWLYYPKQYVAQRSHRYQLFNMQTKTVKKLPIPDKDKTTYDYDVDDKDFVKPDLSKEDRSMMESLVLEYAEIEFKQEVNDTYDPRAARRMVEIENELLNSGIHENIIEENLDLARDIVAYST